MYTLQGKPNQHATHFPRSVRVWPSTIRISRGPHIATFHESSTGLDRCTALEKKCSQLQFSARLSGPWDPTQFLLQHNHWSSALKPNTYWRQTTRLIGPISPVCNQYVQYLLTGVNPSVLNWHKRRLQPWRCRLSTYHSPTFPISDLHFSPNGTTQSYVIQSQKLQIQLEREQTLNLTSGSLHFTSTVTYHLNIALLMISHQEIGLTRINRKVNHNATMVSNNSYKLNAQS
jgi:hypothetical protein